MDKIVADLERGAPRHPGHRRASRRAATTPRPSSSPPPRRATRRTSSRPSTSTLPSFVAADAVADITARARARSRAEFSEGSGSLVTLGTDAVYAHPAGQRPDDALLPRRPVRQVRHRGAQDLGRVRRGGPHRAQEGPQGLPRHVLQQGPRLVRRPRPAGGRPVVVDQRRRLEGDRQRRAPPRRSPTTGAAWSSEGVIDDMPLLHPRVEQGAQRRHAARPGRPRSGRPACCRGNAPKAKGKWASRRCRSGPPART